METLKRNVEPNIQTLSAVFDNSPAGIALIREERFVILNHRFCEILQLDQKLILGSPIKTVFQNQVEYIHIIHLESFELVRIIQGERSTFHVNSFPIFDAEGNENILLFIIDISKYKRIADKTLEQQQELDSIFNLTPSFLLLLDNRTQVININDPALQLGNKKRTDSVGLQPGNILECIRSYDSPDGCGAGPHCKQCVIRRTFLETLLTGKNNYNVEAPFMLKQNGNVKNLTLLVTTIVLERNQGNYVLLAINDITEQKQLEKELIESKIIIQKKNLELERLNLELTDSYNRLRQAHSELMTSKEKAEESDRLKTSFLANMSHEIRTPLNGIVGFLELIKNNTINRDQQISYINIINQCAGQLLHMMNDIIELSKIQAGEKEIHLENTDINQILKETYQSFCREIQNKKLEFPFPLELADNNKVMTDDDKLRQILFHLLNNSLKFTVKGKIEFGCNIAGNFYEFFVRDTGIGIEEKHFSSIFEHFRQVEHYENREFGGIGVGLTLAKAYVEMLGGKIWLESTPGKGTTFFFTVPINSNYNEIEITAMNKPRELINWSDRTFLIVEDEEVNVQYLQELLKMTKANLLYAITADEAIEACKNHPEIDLVLMDIKLPGMNGYEATRRIKKIRHNLPVIAQTAYAMSSDRTNALKAGCDDYIAKPIRSFDLLDLIGRYLSVKPN